MESIAFGELNMNLDEFYSMTPRNFANAQIGSRKLYEQNQQAEWERARWMACVIINPHLKKSVEPKKITTFPWEKIIHSKLQAKRNIEKIKMESAFDDKIKEMNKSLNKN